MTHSLYRPTVATSIEHYRRNNRSSTMASNRQYRMAERQGRFFQLDADGREINSLGVEVTYVVGSGTNARSFLDLQPSGELIELPVTSHQPLFMTGLPQSIDGQRCHAPVSAASNRYRPITEQRRMQVGLGTYATNTPHWGNPNIGYGSTSFGIISSANNARSVQVAGKF